MIESETRDRWSRRCAPARGRELDSILRSQVSRLPGRFETLDSLLMAGLDVVNMGRDARYYTDYAAQLRQLDGNALNAQRPLP